MKNQLKNFVSPEVARLLREKGFNEPCFAYFTEDNQLKFCMNGHNEVIEKNNYEFGTSCSAPTFEDVEEFCFKNKIHADVFNSVYYSFVKQSWAIAYTNHPDFENDILSTFYVNKHEAMCNRIIQIFG